MVNPGFLEIYLNLKCVSLCWVGFIYLFGVLHRFQHCTGHITKGQMKPVHTVGQGSVL